MEKNTAFITISLKPSQKAAIEKYCNKKGKSVSLLFRDLLAAVKIIKL